MSSFWIWAVLFVSYTLLGICIFSLTLNEDGKPGILPFVGKWKRPFRVMFNLSFVYFWPVYLAVGFAIGAGSALWEAVRGIFA